MNENKPIYLRYRDYSAVEVNTHVDAERKGLRLLPILIVSHLITAALSEPISTALGIDTLSGPFTVHLTPEEEPLEPDRLH
jgi:hypothetical protein